MNAETTPITVSGIRVNYLEMRDSQNTLAGAGLDLLNQYRATCEKLATIGWCASAMEIPAFAAHIVDWENHPEKMNAEVARRGTS